MDSEDTQTTASTPTSAATVMLPPPHAPTRSRRPRDEHRYIISVETGDRASWGGGTSLPVAVTLIGDQGISRELILNSLPNSLRYAPPRVSSMSPPSADMSGRGDDGGADARDETLFSSGSVREFETRLLSVGDVVKLRVRLLVPKDSFDAAWKLEKVLITDDTLHRGWRFVASRWLNAGMPDIEVEHSGDVSVGRRAIHISARRLSNPNPDMPIDAPSTSRFTTSMSFFKNASLRKRLSADPTAAPMLPSTGDGGAATTDGGVRRVCFQVQKFDRPNCHLYLSGDTDMMGKWHVQKALRMRMVTAADGTFSGEWRLELEMDDASATIDYAYLVLDEASERAWWENGSMAKPRQLKLVGSLEKDDPTDRTVEGGVLYVKDIFYPIPSADYETSGTSRKNLTRLPSYRNRSSLSSSHEDVLVAEKKSDESIPNVDFSYLCGDDDGMSSRISVPDLNFSSSSDFANIPTSHSAVELARKLIAVRDVLTQREGVILALNQQIRDLHSTVVSPGTPAACPESHMDAPAPSSDGSCVDSNRARTSPVSSDFNTIDDGILDSDADDDLLRADREETLARVRVIGEELKAAQLAMARQVANNVESDCDNLRQELAALRTLMSSKCEEHESSYAELVRLLMDGQDARAAELSKLTEERNAVQQRWNIEFAERRRLFNLVQELRGNIRVFCRVRPVKQANGDRDTSQTTSAVTFPDIDLGLLDSSSSIQVCQRRFEFDHVFQSDSDQQSVYAETSGVVISVLDGYNVCVFAYGQTGSGKTFTMNGSPADPGVNYRALTDLFENIEKRSTYSEFEVCVSMMEIYNENLRDLLFDTYASSSSVREGPAPKLEIRKDPASSSQSSVYVPNLTSVVVSSVDEVWKLMECGGRARAQHATDMNEHSSRSHLILSVKVSVTNKMSHVRSSGTLSLVDLAGSERLNRSNAAGERLKEAQFINKSLSTLGDVFMALVENSHHVPYRNSKLTYLLQESLGGDSKTLMFVNVSCDESDAGETLSSLQFAQRVARVERGAASKHLDTSRFKISAASDAGKEKDGQIISLQARLANAERELRKREDSIEGLRRRAIGAETELKTVSKLLEEQKKRDGIDKKAANVSAAASVRELADLRLSEEKRKEELRVTKVKLRDVAITKDEQIKRLQNVLDERNAQIRRLQLEPKSSATGARACASSGLESSARHTTRARMPPRIGAGSRTFTSGQTRTVRFESVKSPEQAAEVAHAPEPGGTGSVSSQVYDHDHSDPSQGMSSSEADNEMSDVISVDINGAGLSDRSDEDSGASVLSNKDTGAVGESTSGESGAFMTENNHSGGGENQPTAAAASESLFPTVSRPHGPNSIRPKHSSLARTPSRTMSVSAPGLTPVPTGPPKRGGYAFGTRVDSREGAGVAPTPTRTPRSTPNLRPAQRLVSTSIPRGQTAIKVPVRPPARAGSGPRRAGTFTAGAKPPSSQL